MVSNPIDASLPGLAPEFQAFVRRLPKVELHIHLEGSLRPSTLRELGAKNGRPQAEIEDWIKEREQTAYGYGSFRGFIEAFKFAVMLLQEPEDYGLVAARLFEELASQRIRYAEVTLSAGVVLWRKQPLESIFAALDHAAQQARTRWKIHVQWIFDAVRQFGAEPARNVVTWAQRLQNRSVVAFGIGGDERQGPPGLFADVYREARDSGLRLTAHAGETGAPESVAQAVNLLGAERIGHGLAAARDARVMALLAERRVPLEVCISSNVSTGVLQKFGDYPWRRLRDAGVPLTLNSDDPGLFGASLQGELLRAAFHFALSHEEAVQLCRNAIHFSFLAAAGKQALAQELETAAGMACEGNSTVRP